MKQPDKTKTKQPATKTASPNPADATAKKQPGAPGALPNDPIEAGKPAQAGQPGTISTVNSTLVGDPKGGLPAAAAKPDAGKSDAGKSGAGKPETAKSDFAKTDAKAATKPADMKGSDTRASATPTTAKPAPKQPVKKTGFWPVAFGGVVAAGLGAAAAIYALPNLPPEWQPAVVGVPTDQADVAALAQQAARRAVAEEIAAMPAPAGVPDDLDARLSALEGRPQAAAADPAEGQQFTDQLQALTRRLDEQQAQLDKMAENGSFDSEAAGALQQQIEAAAADAEARLEAARAEAQELQDAAAESTRRAEAVAAIASLQSALDRGVTPEDARATLEGAGLETPDALTAEVPSLTSLQADFPEAARAALRASLRDSSATGQGNMLTNFLKAQTGARSIEAREGNDADAVLSRADAEVEAGRIAEALSQIDALPDAGRDAPAMAGWLTRANAYSQAQSALTDLSSGQN
ncbi:hypothetical protein [Paracoccus sp. R86501]|uniref:COG4223 family protein n=1 Tax=Paracoccus sp. R86501 TaxID=3101711 RepID=UPI0036723789